MSSFTFNSKHLRPFAAALAVITLIEAVVGIALRPNIVERSKFNLLNRFQNTVIFGKLAEFADSSPDIVQVGDSSGFWRAAGRRDALPRRAEISQPELLRRDG